MFIQHMKSQPSFMKYPSTYIIMKITRPYLALVHHLRFLLHMILIIVRLVREGLYIKTPLIYIILRIGHEFITNQLKNLAYLGRKQ